MAIAGVTWALVLPPWQSPDEQAHFGYAQLLAERFELPDTDPSRRAFATEYELALDYSNASQTAGRFDAKPEWSELRWRAWQAAERELGPEARSDGGGSRRFANPARTNPPLYYAYESVPYSIARSGDVFDRLYAMRLGSVLLLLVTTTGAWLLVGELFGRNRPLQLAGAATAGLQPMATFISASVNPDGLVYASSALALWLAARIVLRGVTLASGAGLGAAVAVAVLTKASSYALVPPLVAAVAAGIWHLGAASRRRAALAAGVAALVFALPVAAWLVTAGALDRAAVNQVPGVTAASADGEGLDVRELGSYLWQYYLPGLPFMQRFHVIGGLPAYEVWIKTGWAAFGWLEVKFPEAVYLLLAALTAVLLVAGAVGVARLCPQRPRVRVVLGVLALAAVCLLGGLHWTEYRIIDMGGDNFNQGRYLLPLLPLLSLAVAGALGLLSGRRRALAIGGLLGGLLTLQLASLAITVARFYA